MEPSDLRSGHAHAQPEAGKPRSPRRPTVLDVTANAAFFYGLVHTLRTADRPLWTRMAFKTATDNFLACSRLGLDAVVYWPGIGDIPVAELVVRHLVPMAADGLRELGVEDACINRYLGVIGERARCEQNGASWQVAVLGKLEASGFDRASALTEMTRHYWHHMHSNESVHQWALD